MNFILPIAAPTAPARLRKPRRARPVRPRFKSLPAPTRDAVLPPEPDHLDEHVQFGRWRYDAAESAERGGRPALAALIRLRQAAADEIERLLQFLDDTAGEEDAEALDEPTDAQIKAMGGYDVPATDDDEDGGDMEPSLGSKCMYEHSTQDGWALQGNGCLDGEDEHDGAEPGEDAEPSLGALEGHTDQRAAWRVATLNDYELDHSESGIGDRDGLLEQVGSRDWTQTVMA